MLPFKGEAYVDREQVLRTGITKVIGIEIVKEFILNHKQELIEKGYFLRDLFNVPDSPKLKTIH